MNETRQSGCLTSLLIAMPLLAIHLLVLVAVLGFLGMIVPSFGRTFESFAVELPWMTRALLQLSEVVVSFWPELVVAFLAVDVPVMVLSSYVPFLRRWVRWIWFDAWLLAAIAALCWGIVALFVPLSNLFQELS